MMILMNLFNFPITTKLGNYFYSYGTCFVVLEGLPISLIGMWSECSSILAVNSIRTAVNCCYYYVGVLIELPLYGHTKIIPLSLYNRYRVIMVSPVLL